MRKKVKLFLLLSFFLLIAKLIFPQTKPELKIFPNYNKNVLNIEVKNFVTDEIKSFIKYGIKFKLILKIDIFKKNFFVNKKIREILKERNFYYDLVKDVYLVEDNTTIITFSSYNDFLKSISKFNFKINFCKYKNMIFEVDYKLFSNVGRKYELKEKFEVRCKKPKKRK